MTVLTLLTKELADTLYSPVRSATDKITWTLDETPTVAGSTRGPRFNKVSAADTDAHGIIFQVAEVDKWIIGIDYLNEDFVLAYNPAIGDMLRMAPTGELRLAAGTGSPLAQGARFQIVTPTGSGHVGLHVIQDNLVAGVQITQGNVGGSRAAIQFGSGTNPSWDVGQDPTASGSGSFYVRDVFANAFRMCIDSSGNFSIGPGTGAAAATLDIALPATTSLKVRHTGGSTLGFTATSTTANMGTYNNAGALSILQNGAARIILGTGGEMGFFGSAGTTRPTITGSRGGNAALADLLTKLASLGVLIDSST